MNLFQSTLAKLKIRKEIKENGGYIGIPYPFERLNNELSGIQKGEQIIVTANSGINFMFKL